VAMDSALAPWGVPGNDADDEGRLAGLVDLVRPRVLAVRCRGAAAGQVCPLARLCRDPRRRCRLGRALALAGRACGVRGVRGRHDSGMAPLRAQGLNVGLSGLAAFAPTSA